MSTIFIGIPLALWLLIGLIASISIVFLLFKRPIYEAMIIGFLFSVVVTGQYGIIWSSIQKSILNTTTFAICAFVLLGYVFEKSGVMKGVVDLTYAATGRLFGGAGWVTIISCAFMGALTGTVMASIAAVGVFAIPAMKKSGYRPEVAAATSISAGCFGPMIPPSTTIILSAGIYETIVGSNYNQGKYWTAVWMVAIWFILQRSINLIFAARKDKVKKVPKSELPSIKESFINGWKALIIPIIIFIPFIINNNFSGFLNARLNPQAVKSFGSVLLLWIPAVTTVYCLFIGRKKIAEKFSKGKWKTETYDWGKGLVKQISPLALTIIFAQAAATVFSQAGVGPVITAFFSELGLSSFLMSIIAVLIFAGLGTVLSGTAMISVVGATVCTALVATGVNPLVACAVLPSLAASSGLTPPMAAGMYATIGIAESGFKETAIMMLKYLFWHLVVAVLVLNGLLPIFGV